MGGYDGGLREFLRGQLEGFLATPYERRSGGPVWAADWVAVNGNNGTALLERGARERAAAYLNGIEATGCRAVGMQVQYPLLDEGFPRWEAYLDFYRWAVGEARRRGFMVYMESSPAFTGTGWSGVRWDYGEKGDHVARRISQACRVVLELAPDYLSVTHEPQTEQAITGHRLTTEDCLGMVTAVAACRDGAARRTQIGGGLPVTAAWEELAAYDGEDSAADFVTVHVYAAAFRDGLETVNGFARLVEYAGRLRRPVWVGEAGLFKGYPMEIWGDPLRVAALYERDPYVVWEPVDALAAEAFQYAGECGGILGVNWFWSQYMFGYYEGTSGDVGRARRVALRRALRNAGKGRLTGLGEMVRKVNSREGGGA